MASLTVTSTPHFDSLYIVHRGVALYDGKVLRSGMMWGEDMILESDKLRRHVPACSMTYLEVFTLSRESLVEIAQAFPDSAMEIRKCAIRLALRRAVLYTAHLKREEAEVLTKAQESPRRSLLSRIGRSSKLKILTPAAKGGSAPSESEGLDSPGGSRKVSWGQPPTPAEALQQDESLKQALKIGSEVAPKLDARMDGLDTKVGNLDRTVAALDRKLDAKMTALDGKIDQMLQFLLGSGKRACVAGGGTSTGTISAPASPVARVLSLGGNGREEVEENGLQVQVRRLKAWLPNGKREHQDVETARRLRDRVPASRPEMRLVAPGQRGSPSREGPLAKDGHRP